VDLIREHGARLALCSALQHSNRFHEGERSLSTIVETRSGRIEGVAERSVQAFRGIPFAAPPVGRLRFAAPQREVAWAGVRSAKEFGASAPQNPMMLPLPGMDVGAIDEDCLYLNVYTPAADSGRRPVMVWIHGGGFVIGSGSQSLYDGIPLAARGDVVVVTVNYRLGPLGFLHLADLCPELEGATGNAGIRDQLAALEWVQENISAFGGDPTHVTIFGESAGGMSVGTLLGMPAARPLFRRAISQSGAAHNCHTRETATTIAEHFLETLGIAPADAVKLREIPPDKLLDGQQQTVLKLGSSLGLLPFQPLVDGDSLPQSPLAAVEAGSVDDIDLLVGTTRDEWKLFGMLDPKMAKLDEEGLLGRLERQLGERDTAERLLGVYKEARPDATTLDLFFAIETDRVFWIPAVRLAEAQSRHGDSTFMYQFTWESPAMGGALGACHAVELPFVFGVLDAKGAEMFAGGGPEAEHLSEVTMDAWLAFAREGRPGHAGLPGSSWEPYSASKRTTMILGAKSAAEYDLQSTRRNAWDGLL
jgi:para-nitrobenzyl esterase